MHKEMFRKMLQKCEYLSDLNFDDTFFLNVDIFLSCIVKWGKNHNIVSNKFTDEDIYEAIADSLIGASFLSFSNAICDAGSGGGFPGMVIAMAHPRSSFTLVESNRKKCSFLRLVKAQLGLSNVLIENERIEKFKDLPFIVTKAAFSPPDIGILAPSLQKGGHLALWSTKKSCESFIEALLKAGLKLEKEYDYELNGGKERLILLFRKVL